MSRPLSGKVALVTGGSRGMGRAIALKFAGAGADVVIAGRKLPDLEKVAEEIRGLGRTALAVPAHIGRMDEIDKLASKAREKFGRIDILVNNAGANPTHGPALDADERLWNGVMNLNLKGLFFLSQAIARLMKDSGGGNIVNIASIAGLKPELNMDLGIYCISKAGVIMATKVMAKEWAQHNIRVNAVAPGHVRTPLHDSGFSAHPDLMEEVLERTPVRRMAEPEEIANAVLFLASDASSFMTGETMVADGGLMLT